MKLKYKRILLKLSGEQLAGKFDVGIDPVVVHFLAEEIKPLAEAGCEIAIVVGGGNMVRGHKLAGEGIKRVTADHMGMLSGLMNAMATTDIFEADGISTRCLSHIFVDQVAESYSFRRALKHLEHHRVIIIAGGMARSYFSHDTGAVSMALELDCDVMLKATKVGGVFDHDPVTHPGAKMFDQMTFQEAVENKDVQVMDSAALGLAMEQKMPMIIFNAMERGNLLKVVTGEKIGTSIS